MKSIRPFARGRWAALALILSIGAGLGTLLHAQRPAAPKHRYLLLVLDGLRPDYVTPELMPSLYALGQRGVVYANHHAVYPTVTRVNSSSISTGAYPETHGLMGNSVFFPEVDTTKFLNTGDRAVLMTIAKAVGGRLLTAPTLAETVHAAGQRMLVVSSGGTGSSFLLNPTLPDGPILHTDYAVPESLLAEERAALGPVPEDGTPNDGVNQRAVDAFLKVALKKYEPQVTAMWFSDPDHTAHAKGIGDPVTTDALKKLDGAIQRLQDGLKAAGLLDSYNILVTSDHGFSTHTGKIDMASLLKPFQGVLPDGSPRIVTDGEAIYVRDHDQKAIAAIVAVLQKTPGAGAIFTKAAAPKSMDGQVPGTLSFDAAHWAHARSADVLVSPDWTDAANKNGWRGTVSAGGVAGHGSTSPFDIHNTLVAAGPDIRQGVVIQTPSANVDLAPTILRGLGIARPASMQGRVLEEAFRDGPAPAAVSVKADEHSVKTADGSYAVTATFSLVKSGAVTYRYFDRTVVRRGGGLGAGSRQ